MKYEGIAMVRIDDRLIHGQVMTSWLNFLGANKIMVIDDGVAVDPLVKNILKSCIPANIKLAVFTEDKAVERLKKGFAGDTVIVLVKYPKTLYSLMQKGILFDEICRETALGYAEVTRAAGLLEEEGFICVDLLQRCSINTKNV